VSVPALFKRAGAPRRLSLITDGESLFNDATAIGSEGQPSLSAAVVAFLRVFSGGALTGLLAGGVGRLLSRFAC
jgi:CPA1 family monovalent cation:H+ antiporter